MADSVRVPHHHAGPLRADGRGEPSISPALEVNALVKSFGATRALKGVSFAAHPGEIHALVGGNGSGKSTLIKVLAGVHEGDAGSVTIGGREFDARAITPAIARDAGLRFVHQATSTFAALSVTENLLLGRGFDTRLGWRIPWRQARRRTQKVLEEFEIDARPDSLLGELNPAMQTLVAIARALQDQEDAREGVLVLDEPTASLPAYEVGALLDGLRGYAAAGRTILYVSHRLNEVLDAADTVTVLRDGECVGTAPKAGLNHDRLVHMIMGRKADQLAAIGTGSVSTGPPVLEVANLTGGPVRGAQFKVAEGEIVGIAGLLGSGRSSILGMLFGLMQPSEPAEMFLDGKPISFATPGEAMKAGIALVPEDRARDAAFADMTVGENLSMSSVSTFFRRGYLSSNLEASEGAKLVSSHLIKTHSLTSSMGSLSGGNQQKVILARWLRRNPRLLLLDEPTQGVDVGARVELWGLVRSATARGTAVLVVSSDLEELADVCSIVLILRDGRIVSAVEGADLTEQNLENLTLGAP